MESTVALLKLAFETQCFLRIEYRLPSNDIIDLAIIITQLNEEKLFIKGYVYDLENGVFYDEKPLTYRIKQVSNIALFPVFTYDVTTINPIVQSQHTALLWSERFNQPMQPITSPYKSALDCLKHLSEISPSKSATLCLLKTELSIQKGNEVWPIISRLIQINPHTHTMKESPLFVHKTVQLKNDIKSVYTRIKLNEMQLMNLYHTDKNALIELLEHGLLYDESLMLESQYHMATYQYDGTPLYPLTIKSPSHILLKALKEPLSKHHLKHISQRVISTHESFDMNHALLVYSTFKYPLMSANIDYGFKKMSFIELLLKNAYLQNRSVLIVVDSMKEKLFMTHKLMKDFPLIMNPSSNASLNQALNYIKLKAKNKGTKNITKCLPIELMTQHHQAFESFKALYEWIERFENISLSQENFNQFVRLSALKTKLLQTNQDVLQTPYYRLNQHFETVDGIAKAVCNQSDALLEKLSYKQYKSLLKVIHMPDTNDTEADIRAHRLMALFKTKRYAELLHQIFTIWIVDKNDFSTLKHMSYFDNLIVMNSEHMPLYEGRAWFSKAHQALLLHHGYAHVDIAPQALYETFAHQDFKLLNRSLTTHLYSSVEMPHMHLTETYKTAKHSKKPICLVESHASEHQHHVEKHVQIIEKLINAHQKIAVMTVFNDDYKKLKNAFKSFKNVTVLSTHKAYNIHNFEQLILNIPVHQNTPIKTYDWLKNNQSLIQLLKTTHENLSLVVQMDVLKQFSKGADLLYQLVHKQLQRMYIEPQPKPQEDFIAEILQTPVKHILWVMLENQIYESLQIQFETKQTMILDDHRNLDSSHRKLSNGQLKVLYTIIQEIIE